MPFTVYEFSAISKQLRFEQLLMKKYKVYSSLCSDQPLKLKFEQMAAEHQTHLERLLNQLN